VPAEALEDAQDVCKEYAEDGADVSIQRRNAKAMLRAGEGTLEGRLYSASLEGFLNVVQQLISEGANVNSPTKAGRTPLLAACSRGHLSCVRALLDAGADANWFDNSNGYHGLLFASEMGHVEIVKLLLSQPGIKVNMSHKAEGSGGDTPLLRAALFGHIEVVKALLTNPDIDVNAKNAMGQFALYEACGLGYKETVFMLLAHPRIDVNLSNEPTKEEGSTSLSAAASQGHADVVSALLAHPNIDLKSSGLNTECLIVASEQGHHEVARLLVSHPDVDVNRLDRLNGATALHWACQEGHIEVMRVLLTAPCIDVNKKDMQDFSALAIAKQYGHAEIATLIVEAGAR